MTAVALALSAFALTLFGVASLLPLHVNEDAQDGESPLSILRRRYSKGEIDSDEFRRIRADLQGDLTPRRNLVFRQLAPWAAWLSIAAGAIHFAAAPEHLEEWWGYGGFFLVAGFAQVAYGLLLLQQPRRSASFYVNGLLGTLDVIALYVVSRTLGIPPLGPAAGELETMGVLDITSKLVELVLMCVLVMLLWNRRRVCLS